MRFPGFEGEWDEQSLGELAEISSGGTPSRTTPAFWGGKIPWITTSLINFNVIKEANEFITEQGVKGSSAKLFPKNTILMAMYGQGKTRGQVAILDIEATTNQACAAIMPKSNLIDYSFLFQNLSKRYDEIRELSNQGGQQNLSGGIIKGLTTLFPSLKEQKKIAGLLSKIDLRIATQSKIIEHNKSLIKGILKWTCLTSKTWKRQYLKEILTERKETNKKQHPVFSVSVSRGLINQIEYLGRSFAAKNTEHYNVANFGDIIYTKSPTGSFPYGIIKQSFVSEKVAISPLYAVYEPKSIDIGIILHFHFNDPVNVSNYLHRIIQKGAKNTISVTNQQFLTNEVFLPTDKNEIKNLARLLQILNKKIEIEETILDKLFKQKQYFLQQMFI